MIEKITPCLWYDNKAEEAANFYVSIFPKSKILRTTRYDKASSEVSGMPEDSVLTVEFELDGQKFVALNGGPVFKFTSAVSFIVNCETQEEVDHYWHALTNGGKEVQCGWLEDKYGLSWQVTPSVLDKMLADPDKEKAGRAMKSMLGMKKLDIAELKRAYEGD